MSCCCNLSYFAAKGLFFFFPLHLSGQQMLEKNKWNVCPPDVTCRTRVILYFYNHRGLACFRRSVGLRRGKEQGITVLIIFFFLKNPTNSSICLQRKCRCSNVGCCCLVDCSASPGSSARTQCFLYIYLYLYISIYIYASSFPVSHQ